MAVVLTPVCCLRRLRSVDERNVCGHALVQHTQRISLGDGLRRWIRLSAKEGGHSVVLYSHVKQRSCLQGDTQRWERHVRVALHVCVLILSVDLLIHGVFFG